MLMYRCPNSGKPVCTVIETTEHELRRLAAFKLSVWCPHCDDAHVILGKDASVAPAPIAVVSTPSAVVQDPSTVRVAA
jgi:hypothetical protein